MPQSASNLSRIVRLFHVEDMAASSADSTHLEITVQEGIKIDGFRVNVSKYNTNDGDSVLENVNGVLPSGLVREAYLALASVIDSTCRDKGLGAAKGISQHKVLKPRVGRWAI